MIDIIIPNYNGAAFLPTCLDALRRQTRRDFCVVVVDDGSTDDSRELLRRSQRQVALAQLAEHAVSTIGVESFCKDMLKVLAEQLKLSHAGVCDAMTTVPPAGLAAASRRARLP